MAGAGPWNLYNDAKLHLEQGAFNLASDSFLVALVTSGSNALSATMTPATYGALTDELPTANGYTAGGVGVTGPGLTGGGAVGTINWSFSGAASWTASGAGFTARAAVIYDNTSGSKYLFAWMLLDSTPADVTVAAGNGLQITITGTGIFNAT